MSGDKKTFVYIGDDKRELVIPKYNFGDLPGVDVIRLDKKIPVQCDDFDHEYAVAKLMEKSRCQFNVYVSDCCLGNYELVVVDCKVVEDKESGITTIKGKEKGTGKDVTFELEGF